MHSESIPRGGGMAIFAAFFVSCMVFGRWSLSVACTLAGGVLMLLVGLSDDIFCLPPVVKLFFQAAIATATVLGSGLARDWGIPLAIFWVVTLTNAHNFIDGMDGLFAGCGAMESIALTVAFALAGKMEAACFPLLLSAACLGFYCFNRYPAYIFAGDGGSGTVGFLLGMLSLQLFELPIPSVRLLTPFLIFGYPLTDLLTAVFRRTLRGKSPFSADRGHLHHRLSAVGLMQPQCVRVLHALSGGLAVIGVLLAEETLLPWASVACVGVVVLMMRVRRFILGFS